MTFFAIHSWHRLELDDTGFASKGMVGGLERGS